MRVLTISKILLSVILFVGLSNTVLAQGNPDRSKGKRGMRYYNHSQHLQIPDLSDKQKEQIKSIMLENRKAVLPLQNQLREKRARLRTLSTGDDIDMDAAEAVIEEIGDLRTEIMKKRYATRQEIRSLLTEDQRVWFDSRAGSFWGKQMRGSKRLK